MRKRGLGERVYVRLEASQSVRLPSEGRYPPSIYERARVESESVGETTKTCGGLRGEHCIGQDQDELAGRVGRRVRG